MDGWMDGWMDRYMVSGNDGGAVGGRKDLQRSKSNHRRTESKCQPGLPGRQATDTSHWTTWSVLMLCTKKIKVARQLPVHVHREP